ncbi:MAG: hypothetical protein US68_C0005G0031 [Candidatus Shapirobacteria bacterium GW2011_GWE1_38_10]|uniref:Prolipoprotein diacylglyceryl transferase n=1 Tax=Candidatus Shapirobacteria bacterium GW2011_GWE1_38_10 TaxID=1618488 RepID=A0A0G0KMS3_9BACT|nr:MAG: hypothetical protein US46_C0001G0024 [Candidatus Shapirobacteria bacterium GW2011_GWF2_37_20]KKQ50464.1 MAG: hypothetical protein US68_C0005G0031 [Candidatus Shapirobacteria bacterium GW2011_GWE1_38_10]
MIVLGILGLIGYLYLSWRTLRENYQEEDIIAFSWVAILLFLVGGRLSYGLINWGVWVDNPGAWLEFWRMDEASLIGASGLWMAFVLLITRDKDWKIWPFLENSLVSVVFLLMISALILMNWPIVLALVGAIVLTVPMKKKYRSLQWYKSGRKGFLFFWFSICFWLIFAVISRLWWTGGISLLFIVGLFMLGNDKLSK